MVFNIVDHPFAIFFSEDDLVIPALGGALLIQREMNGGLASELVGDAGVNGKAGEACIVGGEEVAAGPWSISIAAAAAVLFA